MRQPGFAVLCSASNKQEAVNTDTYQTQNFSYYDKEIIIALPSKYQYG